MTFIQRFGSSSNLNIHGHLLVPDGAWTFPNGRARFHRARAPSQGEVKRLLEVLMRRIMRTLVRVGGLVEEQGAPYLDFQPEEGLGEPPAARRVTVMAPPRSCLSPWTLSELVAT